MAPEHRIHVIVPIAALALSVLTAAARDVPRVALELEAGPGWQRRNDIQIPNEAAYSFAWLNATVVSGIYRF